VIVTEEEAKTKRCQESFGPPLSQDGRTINAFGAGGAYAIQTSPTHCIGSACMAWREILKAEPAFKDVCTTHSDKPPTHGEGWTFLEGDNTGSSWSREMPAKPAKGYCGKAGRP